MKNMKWLSCCIIAISTLGMDTIRAETTEVVLSNSMKCTKEELMAFFPQQVVQSVLLKANLPKEEAEAIAVELANKDRELTKIVEEKAANVNPNPFKDLSQRDSAMRIYRETLYEVFSNALKAHGITNRDQIQTLLDEMQAAKSKLFIECIRKQQTKSTAPPSS